MNRRLWRLIRPYRTLLAAAVLLLLLLSVTELAGPYFTQQAIDRYIAPKRLDGYQWLAILWFFVLIANGLARYAQLQLTNRIGQRVMFDLRNAIFAHWQRMGVAFFDRTAVGELVSLISNDVDAINQVFTSGLILGIGNVVSAVFIIVFLLLINWPLALIVLGMAVVMLAAATFITRQLRQAQRWTRSSLGSINGFIQEAVSGITTIQLFNADRRIRDDFDVVNQQYSRANLHSATLFSIFLPLMNWFGAATVGLLLWFGGGRVIHHLLTLGTLVLFIQFAERLITPVRDLADKLAIFQTAVASAERIFALLDRPATDADAATTSAIKPGSVGFDHAWFAYQGEDWVLKDVSFQVAPGEKVAIVGATGAGKSSLISVLIRFYDIQKGVIRLGGQDIRGLDRREIRRRIGVVFQDPFIFTGTVGYNISLGESMTPDRVERAAAAVYADSFIGRLRGGYDYVLHERGSDISTGQKQLLSFARAFAFEPDILLVLDEATASVDPETERIIQASLLKLVAGRTSIIIAHRLSTIEHADRIIVLHKGQVVETGTHTELLARQGVYSRLYELQYKDQLAAP
jgi:ATP-binding cassette, subfamily B, multidrug efflux pump